MISGAQNPYLQLLLRKSSNAIAFFFYGNSSHGHWLYEKMHRPATYFHEMMNVLYFLTRRAKLHRTVSVLIEPVFGCNRSCQYCWQHISPCPELGEIRKRPRLMSWAVFEKAVLGLPPTVESVCLTGLGEPLMHPEIFDMIDYIDRHGFRVSIYTNGTLLNEQVINKLAASSVSVVNISIEPDKESLEAYRQVAFDELRKNILQFIAKKREGTELKFSLVAHPGNMDRLEQIGATWSPFSSAFKITKQGVYNQYVGFDKCIEPWLGNPAILTNGEVCICCHALGWPIVAGNIEKKPLANIVNSSTYKNILTRLIKKDPPMICSYCSQFDGGCESLRYLKRDSSFGLDRETQ